MPTRHRSVTAAALLGVPLASSLSTSVSTSVPGAGAANASSSCAVTLPSTMVATGGATQLLTVIAATSTSTTAVLTAWTRQGACWSAALGPWRGRVGVHGVRRCKHEGDGATPLGIFSVYSTIYGNGPNPGVHATYRRLRCSGWWDEDVASPTNNSFQQVPCNETEPPFCERRL
jgi:L,D-peptidoglycan transpeptidase YkuD (ErfK/YbiS/YcfS/YnhG family)